MQVLETNPQGIRWSDLLRAVEEHAPDTPHNSVHGGIHNILTTRTSEILKVARGTYQQAKDTAAMSTHVVAGHHQSFAGGYDPACTQRRV